MKMRTPPKIKTSLNGIKITSGELKKYVKRALKQGWTLTKLNNNHLKVIHPNGGHVIVTTTRVNGRSCMAYRQRFKKLGLDVS